MQPTQLTPDLTVSAQIAASDVAAIKAAGFKSIVCHRPDGEEVNQPGYAEIAAAAAAAGLPIRHQPVKSGAISQQDGATFAQLMRDLPKPVFAYCRTGTRCSVVWTLAQLSEASSSAAAPLERSR
jgi:sulfide:quinone oxidoreductase